jgi:hypothetical protein
MDGQLDLQDCEALSLECCVDGRAKCDALYGSGVRRRSGDDTRKS